MSIRRLRRTSAASVTVILAFAIPVSHAAQIVKPVDHATVYVAQRQTNDGSFPSSFGTAHAATADAVISLVATGRGGAQVEKAMDWLEAEIEGADSVGRKAKVVMAAVAAGRDPRSLGGQNLVEQLASTLQDDGSYASSEFSQVYDQALVLLALDAAGANVPRAAVRWLADAQCPDGGWQFDQPQLAGENNRCRNPQSESDFTETDTNTTGLVLQALAAVPRSVPLDRNPFRWLQKRKDRVKGGWGFDRTFSLTDSASTAIVIQAYAAHDRNPPKSALPALRRLQRACPGKGGFARGWIEEEGKVKKAPGVDFGNTVAAILGLLKQPLPVTPQSYLRGLPRRLCADSIS